MIEFRCPKCHTRLKASAEKASAGIRCPSCGCAIRVSAPSVFDLPRPPLRPSRRSRPRSISSRLLMGLGLLAAMLVGAVVVYAAMTLEGWRKDPGADERFAAADRTADGLTDSQPAKPLATAPAAKPQNAAPATKPPDPVPPKPPDPVPAPKPPDPGPPPRPNPDSLSGGTRTVDDLKVTTLTLPVKGLLPCMLWADAEGSAFLVLHSDTGVLRRISFPGLKVTKQKELDGKFSWMSMSAEGLLLSCPDSEKIWVVDPATLEPKTKIEVPKLKRADSALGLSWAVACDQGWYQKQKLYVVDLVKKTAIPSAVPQGNVPGKIRGSLWLLEPGSIPSYPGMRKLAQGNLVGLDNPVVTPDGAFVYTQGYNLFPDLGLMGPRPPHQLYDIPTLFRFVFKKGKLTYQDCDTARISDRDGLSMGQVTISPDSKFVCLPGQPDYGYATPIYPPDTFKKHVCTLDPGSCTRAVGFDLKGGFTYTQNAGHELIILTPHGVKRKEYVFEKPTQYFCEVRNREGEVVQPAYSRPWQEGDPAGVVHQYLVYPSGNQLLLLTDAALYAVGVPKMK